MKYREIYDEYTTLLRHHSQMRFESQSLPEGNIVKKHISGKEYYYLQYTSYGKKKTEYLREAEVAEVHSKLVRRKELKKEIESIDSNLIRLEQAVKILDPQLSRTFFFLRQCADMDALPISKRSNALSFANAMTALEGLPVREETEQNMKAWAAGEKSFADFYIPALKQYRVMESPYEE